MTQAFSGMTSEQKVAVIEFAALAAAAGPTLLIGGKLLALFIQIVPAMKFMLAVGIAVFQGLAGLISAPVLALGILSALIITVLNDLGLLQPAVQLAKDAWNGFGEVISNVGQFFAQFFGFIQGETVTLTEGQQKAVEIMGKAWIVLKGVWLGIQIAFESMVTGLLVAQGLLLKGLEKLTRFLGVDFAADAISGYNEFVTAATNDLDALIDKNTEALTGLRDEWSESADVLQRDGVAILETFTAVSESVKGLIAENTPEFITNIRDRITELRAALGALGGGDAPTTPTGGTQTTGEGEDGGGFFSALTTAFKEAQMTAEKWADFTLQTIDTVAAGFTDGFKAILAGEKGFGKAMIGILDTISTQLLDIAFKSIFQRIAMKVVETKINAASVAPTPFLIPLFVGVAIAGLSAILSGTEFSGAMDGSGGGGGGAAAPPPSAVASVIEPSEEEEPEFNNEPMRIVVEDPLEGIVAEMAVKGTKNGRGDGTSRLSLSTA
jgi:hypothetical protein